MYPLPYNDGSFGTVWRHVEISAPAGAALEKTRLNSPAMEEKMRIPSRMLRAILCGRDIVRCRLPTARGRTPMPDRPFSPNNLRRREAVVRSCSFTSDAFGAGQSLDDKYTQNGEDMSPSLAWSKGPPGTQSFVLVRGCGRQSPRAHFALGRL